MFLALGVLLTACPGIARSQTTSRRPSPAPRMIILPPRVVAREQATLAVVDSSGRLQPGVAVELSGEQKVITDSTGRALFIAPSASGPLIAKISGSEITASTSAIANQDPAKRAESAGDTPGIKISWYPRVLAVTDRFAITGRGFRSAAGLNQVFLGDRQCLVVASSPVSLVVLPGPHIPVGATKLRVSADGRDAVTAPVTAVLLDFSGPAGAPNAGTVGKLILHVHGATEAVSVEVRNASPGIIQLLNGNIQRVGTSGGDENIAPVELKFLSSGDYTITARLVPGDSASPPRGN